MKNASVNVTKVINAPADQVWANVAQIKGIEQWSTPLTDSVVTGEGVGAQRVCNLADGSGRICETIETIDHERKIFRYSIQEAPMPIHHPLGTIVIRDLGDSQTEVSWSVDFQVEEEHEAVMKETITGFYEDGILGLERINAGNQIA